MEPFVDELADIVDGFLIGCVFCPPGSSVVDEAAALTPGWFEESADAILIGFDTQEEEALDFVLAAEAFFLGGCLGDGFEAYIHGLEIERVWQ